MNPLNEITQIIYPPRCVICNDFLWQAPFVGGDDSNLICQSCTKEFRAIDPPFCTVCGIPFESREIENHPCEDCLRAKPFFEAAYAPYPYEGPVLEAIGRLKYGGKTLVADALGPLLGEFTAKRFTLPKQILIMPVPLHPKRLRERGFNQSLLLARKVAKRLDAELDFLSLIRRKQTAPQTTLSRKEREKNVENAFALKSPEKVRHKNILLVDDVATTLNTLNACAKVLKLGGAKTVYCVTLARAVL